MARLNIVHETRYSYERPVGFGPHRLLVRPRDSHAMRITDASLTLSPPGEVRWVYDAMGNCVCWYAPQGQARELSIVSRLTIERFPAPLAPIRPDDPHSISPVVYDGEDRVALSPFMAPAAEDEGAVLLRWLRQEAGAGGEPALEFLLRMTRTINGGFDYHTRHEEGVQTPAETLAMRSGTCRDFAWLMVEAVRRLGYAARFVTGYLNCPADGAMRGAGATHAWCEVFLPDLGWMQFDPTNGLAESADLIRVAATRTPKQAAPVSGVVIGDPGARALQVRVDVSPAPPLQAVA